VPQQPASQGTPTVAIIGLVLAFVMAPVGFVLSIVALVKSKKWGGKGLSIAGVVVSSLIMIFTGGIVAAAVFLYGALSSPGEAVTTMHDAVQDGDCRAFNDVTTESFRVAQDLTTCEAVEELSEDYADYSVQTYSVEIKNSRATVRTTETYEFTNGRQRTSDHEYDLVREGGQWKVNYVD
jgi:hypothetical protein